MKKLYCLVVVIFFACYSIYGQINTQEEPVSFRLNVSTLTKSGKTIKSFASIDMEKIEQEDKEDEKNGIPPRFGYPYKVNYNLDNSGEWVILPNGDRIWRLAISCQDARFINLLYDKFWLPDGAKFFVYSSDSKQTIGAMTSTNNKGDRDNIQGFATGLVYGNQTTLEYYLPKGIKETGIISVSNVIHGYRYISMTTRGLGGSGDCQVNVNCSEGNNWQNEKNAVALIVVSGYRGCTGALVNTTANDGRPLFLTADHCLGGWTNNDVKYDAIKRPNLNHWSFYWHYESSTCIPNTTPPILSTVGATVVANNDTSDFALLRLTEDPRNATGVTPYYLGWDNSGNAGTGGVGIHHPNGDLKKIATYDQTPQTYIYNNNIWHNLWSLNWIQTSNGHSVAEGGSSGSPLINSNRRIIGQLWSITTIQSVCVPDQIAFYGKFSLSWTGGVVTDSRKRLRDWLDPLNTGVSVLDGCNGVKNYSNPSVTGNTTVTSCGTLNVQNTTITSTGTLNLQATNSVNINPNFTVNAGGTLTIQVP